jgi:monoterpene epsilon-lactone hydrolase
MNLPPDVTAHDARFGGVAAIEVAVEPVTSSTTVLYFHGGGYMVGSARSGAPLAAELVRRIGGRGYSVEYRLAPEHPYPAAVNDAAAAYAALLATGVAPGEVVLAGDSAGGGLVMATLLTARDRGLAQPAAAVLFSPWGDLTASGASTKTKANVDPVLTPDSLTWYADHYVPAAARTDPLVSPVFADLAGLPPMLIQVGSHEILLDDALRLASRAAHHDVEVTLEVVAGAPHVFQNQFGDQPEADAALDRAGEYLRCRLRRR